MAYFHIAGLTFDINLPCWAVHKNLNLFSCDAEIPDIVCRVAFQGRPDLPGVDAGPTVNAPGMSIFKTDYWMHVKCYDDEDVPTDAIISKDWTECTLYINPDFADPDAETAEEVRNGIFSFLRNITTALLANRQGLIIHSSSIIWNGKGILFSAPSGTGKSTHAHNWRRLYGTPVLDGDNTAARIDTDGIFAYGLPWCGSSGEFLNRRVPLRAIVFLEQAEKNGIEPLDIQESFVRLVSRSFILPWNTEMANRYLDAAQSIAMKSGCYLLKCLPDDDAVETVRKCLI